MPCGKGAKNGDMANIYELLINVVNASKRKVTELRKHKRLNQKVRGMDRMFYFHPAQSTIPPADRQSLSHRVELKDYGNPDCLHWKVESEQ